MAKINGIKFKIKSQAITVEKSLLSYPWLRQTCSTKKRGRSKPESERNEKRKLAKIERSRIHYEKMGWTWYDDLDAKKKAQAQKAFPRMRGSVATNHFQAMMENKKEESVPDEEEQQVMIKECLDKEDPKEMSCNWLMSVDGIKNAHFVTNVQLQRIWHPLSTTKGARSIVWEH